MEFDSDFITKRLNCMSHFSDTAGINQILLSFSAQLANTGVLYYVACVHYNVILQCYVSVVSRVV